MKKLAVFVHYSRDGKICPNAMLYAEELTKYFDNVIISSNIIIETSNEKISCFCFEKNGYDIGYFYQVLELINAYDDYDTIGFFNDSNYIINSFDSVFEWCFNNDLDFCGITDSYGGRPEIKNKNQYHIQSHFLIFKNDAIKLLKQYFIEKNINVLVFDEIDLFKKRLNIILHYEIGLSIFMRENNINMGSFYKSKEFIKEHSSFMPQINIHMLLWKELVDVGYPLIKRKLVDVSFNELDFDELTNTKGMSPMEGSKSYVKQLNNIYTKTIKSNRYFIQPIFGPTNEMLDINLKSLSSIAEYFDKYDYDIKCIFGGYVYLDKDWLIIEELIKKLFKNSIIKRFDKNYGKSYVVNELVRMSNMTDFDNFLTADSDIIFDLTVENMYERLEILSNLIDKKMTKKFGVISLEQLSDSCHLYENLTEDRLFGNEIVVFNKTKNSSIAGGCMYISMKTWKYTNGYHVKSIYGGSDSSFLMSASSKYLVCLLKSIGVYHNPSENLTYRKWKDKEIHKVRMDMEFNQSERIEEFFKDIINKKSISIIISAFKSQNFIEDCLDSIQNQTYFKNFEKFEILLAVDGCIDTLNKIKEISHKYKNLKLYWNEENSGPYLMFNTLAQKSKYEIISFFGADDIMLDNYIEENIYNVDENTINLGLCGNFNDGNQSDILTVYNPDGNIMINKELFLVVNGFENWRCGADSDLLNRLRLNNNKIHKSSTMTVLRRLHQDNLTKTSIYGHGSEYRENIIKNIGNRTKSKLDILSVKYINEIKNEKLKIAIITTMWQRHDVTKFVFEYYQKLINRLEPHINIKCLSLDQKEVYQMILLVSMD